jgi:hypothetical protein
MLILSAITTQYGENLDQNDYAPPPNATKSILTKMIVACFKKVKEKKLL